MSSAPPKTIYLDQNHLSDLVKPQNGTMKVKFIQFLKENKLNLALTYPHIIETAAIGASEVLGSIKFGDRTLVDKIGEFVDEISMVEMWSADFIFKSEIKESFDSFNVERDVGVLSPFGRWDFRGRNISNTTFQKEVSRVRFYSNILLQHFKTLKRNAAWRDCIKAKEHPPKEAELKNLIVSEANESMKQFMFNIKHQTYWPSNNINDRKRFFQNFRIKSCPSLGVYFGLNSIDRATRSNGNPRRSKRGDIMDQQSGSCAPIYCDFFVTERMIWDNLRQLKKFNEFIPSFKAKVFCNIPDLLGNKNA